MTLTKVHGLLPLAGVLLLGFVASRGAPREGAQEDQVLGSGEHRYRWVKDWARLPEGTDFGNTHGGIVCDSRGRIYVNTDTERAILVFEPDGSLVRSFGAEWKNGLHGMQLVREGEEEYLLIAHTQLGQVARLSLEGEVAWRIEWPEESGLYGSAQEFRPTSVARAPGGRIFVADGYGKSWIHAYDAERKYLFSFGGPGREPGQLTTPHGIWVDTRGEEPVLLVADRENLRVQSFDLDGKHLGVLEVELRRPCTVFERDGALVIAELAGRVSVLDAENRLVTRLGDQPDPELRARNEVPRERWTDGLFLSPHSAAWDQKGDLYVMDWNYVGRVSKLEHLRRR